jgi:ADP-heptose:LPS heptosyltransferase
MPPLFRYFSLVTRRRRAAKECKRILATFQESQAILEKLPPARPSDKKLLVIRLDDIGDYLLFRNQLGVYKKSDRWKDHTVTLLGNTSWKEFFTACDSGSVDDVIWVNKAEYLISPAYRLTIWEHLRARGFDTVIAPSRTRPLLLDDLCMLAAAPALNIGSVNTYVHPSWNQVSDRLYRRLYQPPDATVHEFQFNGQFAEWACGVRYAGSRPTIDPSNYSALPGSYIVCFVGANTRSKRWPARRWVQFINQFRQNHPDRVVVAGASKAELETARLIEQRTGAQSIAGRVSLLELLNWVAGAKAVVTNDTMAAHLGASCGRPTVIIANGVNYARFTEYETAGIRHVATVYPDFFNRKRRRIGEFSCNYEDVVTADIASIKAGRVLDKLEDIL